MNNPVFTLIVFYIVFGLCHSSEAWSLSDDEIVSDVKKIEESMPKRVNRESMVSVVKSGSKRVLFIKYSGKDKIPGAERKLGRALYRRLEKYCSLCDKADNKIDMVIYKTKITNKRVYICTEHVVFLGDYKYIKEKKYAEAIAEAIANVDKSKPGSLFSALLSGAILDDTDMQKIVQFSKISLRDF